MAHEYRGTSAIGRFVRDLEAHGPATSARVGAGYLRALRHDVIDYVRFAGAAVLWPDAQPPAGSLLLGVALTVDPSLPDDALVFAA